MPVLTGVVRVAVDREAVTGRRAVGGCVPPDPQVAPDDRLPDAQFADTPRLDGRSRADGTVGHGDASLDGDRRQPDPAVDGRVRDDHAADGGPVDHHVLGDRRRVDRQHPLDLGVGDRRLPGGVGGRRPPAVGVRVPAPRGSRVVVVVVGRPSRVHRAHPDGLPDPALREREGVEGGAGHLDLPRDDAVEEGHLADVCPSRLPDDAEVLADHDVAQSDPGDRRRPRDRHAAVDGDAPAGRVGVLAVAELDPLADDRAGRLRVRPLRLRRGEVAAVGHGVGPAVVARDGADDEVTLDGGVTAQGERPVDGRVADDGEPPPDACVDERDPVDAGPLHAHRPLDHAAVDHPERGRLASHLDRAGHLEVAQHPGPPDDHRLGRAQVDPPRDGQRALDGRPVTDRQGPAERESALDADRTQRGVLEHRVAADDPAVNRHRGLDGGVPDHHRRLARPARVGPWRHHRRVRDGEAVRGGPGHAQARQARPLDGDGVDARLAPLDDHRLGVVAPTGASDRRVLHRESLPDDRPPVHPHAVLDRRVVGDRQCVDRRVPATHVDAADRRGRPLELDRLDRRPGVDGHLLELGVLDRTRRDVAVRAHREGRLAAGGVERQGAPERGTLDRHRPAHLGAVLDEHAAQVRPVERERSHGRPVALHLQFRPGAVGSDADTVVRPDGRASLEDDRGDADGRSLEGQSAVDRRPVADGDRPLGVGSVAYPEAVEVGVGPLDAHPTVDAGGTQREVVDGGVPHGDAVRVRPRSGRRDAVQREVTAERDSLDDETVEGRADEVQRVDLVAGQRGVGVTRVGRGRQHEPTEVYPDQFAGLVAGGRCPVTAEFRDQPLCEVVVRDVVVLALVGGEVERTAVRPLDRVAGALPPAVGVEQCLVPRRRLVVQAPVLARVRRLAPPAGHRFVYACHRRRLNSVPGSETPPSCRSGHARGVVGGRRWRGTGSVARCLAGQGGRWGSNAS